MLHVVSDVDFAGFLAVRVVKQMHDDDLLMQMLPHLAQGLIRADR